MRIGILMAAFALVALMGTRSRALPPAPLAIVVNSTADPGDGTPDATETTLREAIVLANANPGSTISFAIPGPGPHTIVPNDFLNGALELTAATTIDATTQPGYAGTPLIVLSGIGISTTSVTLAVSADGCTVRGFAFVEFEFNFALYVNGNSNLIEANYVGTDVSGFGATGGTNSTGILVNGGSNTIGGTAAAARNLISGCGRRGIYLPTANNTVLGNWIGTDAAGTAAVPNGIGVEIAASDNTVGGSAAGSGNVISGNLQQGILIDQPGITPVLYTVVQGNYVGTNAACTAALGNGEAGIEIRGSGSAIGGGSAAVRNVISGNLGPGILIVNAGNDVSANDVVGNYIGTDAAGTGAIGNGPKGGIHLSDGATWNFIELGNRIAFNQGPGVWLSTAGIGNVIVLNSIYSNGGLGIDLGPLGVQPNDPGDYDVGPNGLVNLPTLLSAVSEGGVTTVEGTYSGAPSTDIRLEFYSNSPGDPSGYGEGETFQGFVDVTTDASGQATFLVPLAVSIPVGEAVSATATNLGLALDINTSEFSPVVTVTVEVTPPVVTVTTPTADAQVSVAAATIDLGGTATDNVAVTGVTWANSTGGSGSASLVGSDWTIAALPLVAGFNTITVSAVDAQGNGGSDSITVYYDVSTSTTTIIKKTKKRFCGLLGIELLLVPWILFALRRSRTG